MIKTEFYLGKLKQWSYFKFNSYEIWLAGLNSEKKIKNIYDVINKIKIIDTRLCNKILQNLGDHFGIVILSQDWSFAAVDYSRGYPIYWHIKGNALKLSTQANLLSEKEINKDQLIAFRMSGYTTHNNTLWKEVKSLKAGSYLFYKNKKEFYCKKYFTFFPEDLKKFSYQKHMIKLTHQIEKIIKKSIKEVNGKTVIIPLSAGLDSRLIASGLKHFNYKNVKCFSYGLKNNYEAKMSKKISEKLGYEWAFVEINHTKARKFYQSKKYLNYLKSSNDGCATSTIQGLLAIDELIKIGYINKSDILINGNSGDFISGGHIPKKISTNILDRKNLETSLDKILNDHIEKHYSLWDSLKTNYNKNLIKKELHNQLKSEIRKNKIPFYSLIEFLEFENRQTKYVVNSQRIYDFYNLNWLLPLWDKAFIKFWEKVPLKYKLNQRLYKETLKTLNYGGVWTNKFEARHYVSPKWMIYIRFFFKVFFFFIGKDKWRIFEKKYLNYWTENICGLSSIKFFNFCRNHNVARNYVSYYTLIAEKINLGFNWQDK